MNSSSAIQKRLRLLKDTSRLPHGMMLTGDDAEHLLVHAKALIQYALCKNRSAEGPCGQCPSCRKFLSDVHSDFLLIEAEKKEIKIDQVRKAIQWIQLRPNESEEKFCVIFRAELLNRSAANSFLKTLEEPPPHAKIILLTRTADHLLPTIRSRVQVFRFPASQDAAAEARSHEPEWMADLDSLLRSRGSAEAIFNLTSNISGEREDLLSFFERVQRDCLEKMKAGKNLPTTRFRKLEDLYDLALRLESQILRGYGNTAMALDRWLLDWSQLNEGAKNEPY